MVSCILKNLDEFFEWIIPEMHRDGVTCVALAECLHSLLLQAYCGIHNIQQVSKGVLLSLLSGLILVL